MKINKAPDDPIVASVKSFFRPFDAEKGVSAPLSDGRPCQKFMSKAQAQVTLTSGQMFAFMAAPNLASDSNYASVVFAIGAATGGTFSTNGAWKSATTGDAVWAGGTIQAISTNTPYSSYVLANGYEYACVGSGLKFTYEGSELYRGGTLRYLYDKEAAYNNEVNINNWTVDTPGGLVAYVNSAPNTVRQSINKDNVVEINTSVARSSGAYDQCDTSSYTAYSPSVGVCATIGGATATTMFAAYPGLLGYYVNTSGATISFHVDVVEHWAVTAAPIQSLQTPSYAHSSMATHVSAVMDNVRQAHAGIPNTHHATVASSTLKAMKSPMGHELLNVGIRAALA